MVPERLVFNGIDGATGDYLLPAMTAEELSAFVRGERPPESLRELEDRRERASQAQLGPVEGVDPKNLAEAGWGVIFAHDADPAVKKALRPLLDHRREQATRRKERYYREFTGVDAYRHGETKQQFLARHGAGPGPADPDKMPYYLLIVGGPTEIPFRFQYQLDVQYAVGRVDFGTPEDYERYARSVVEAERGGVEASRRAVFFGVRNPGDLATELSHDQLVRPLAESLATERNDWSVETVVAEEATKARLVELLGSRDTPSFLFTASHGVGFSNGHPRQLPHQGALLCQDWPGPEAGRGEVSPDFYVAGDDVADDAGPAGLVSFHFACFSAGTPRLEYFARRKHRDPETIAPHGFLARLPRRLLSHPRGGALAAVGHVEAAWSYSFRWPRAGEQLQVYESTLRRLLDGHPVGSAMEYFNERYAEISSDLAQELEDVGYGKTPDDLDLSRMWTTRNDSRSFVVLGDPAVRLPAAGGTKRPSR